MKFKTGMKGLNNMILDERHECMDSNEMMQLQSERLIKTVKLVYENVAFYRNKMDVMGVRPQDIKSIDDLNKLPFTTKQDLRDNYPYGLMADKMRNITEIHASSGTTGKPVVIGYTDNDIKIWSEAVARCLTAYGMSREDILQVSFGYGLFTGGLGLHYGGEKIGATVIPMSGGNTDKQVRLIRDFEATAIACTPSYALHIAEVMEDMGLSRDDIKLRIGVFGAEPWTEEMRKELETRLGIKAFDIYGLSEVTGPGVAFECERKQGLHINEDYFIPEIIDPKTKKVLKDGEVGELVFTTVTKEGMPLLRYRTRDLTRLHRGKCECGRTLVRMDKILGRSDDMLIIRGVNVFPTQVESVLLDMGEAAPHYQLVVDRVNTLDTLEVLVETNEEVLSKGPKEIERVNKKIKHNVESVLGIGVDLKLVEPKTIERSEGKAKRIIDKRKL